MLLGETAVTLGFKWQPAELQPMGVILERMLGYIPGTTRTAGLEYSQKTQPVYERGEELHK